jgi:DNA-binding transcriptional ArsR family regulator
LGETIRLRHRTFTFSIERGIGVDFVEAKVFWHKLRAQVLSAVRASPARATDLARQLGPPPSKIAYHLTVLERADYVRLAEGQDPDTVDPIFEAVFR